MANQYLNIRDGISVKTTASSPTPAAQGDIDVNLSSGNLQYHNGSSASDIATASNTLTLTNKSLDAAANTFTNIANSAIASAAAIAYSKLATLSINKAVVSDGSGFISASSTTATEIGFVSGVTSSIQTQLDSKLNLSGGTMSGAINMGSHKITSVTDPTSAQDAATKAYVDNTAAGINPAVAVQAATTSSSDLTGYTYNNGVSGIGATLTAGSNNVALTVDGFTFSTLGQRLLVKDNSTSANNGVYYVTQVQGTILPVILTRALDYDTPSDMNNTGAIPVINGTANGTTQWVLTSQVNNIGTDALTFTKFARNPADYLLKANNLSDVSSKTTSFNNVSPTTTKGDIIVNDGTNNVRQAIGTDGQVLVGDSTQTNGLKWTTLQQGAKNYITFNNFENNSTMGWSLGTVGSLTNGLPTGTPTFGSGASGNLSISVVNSGQLAGTASLSYASSAATTQGDMLASQAYTLDLEDQAKVLGYRFYFKAQTGSSNCNFSGTSSNSFALAAWDITNSVFLPVVGAFSMVQGSGVGIASSTFQTNSNTGSIRFIVYNANATAGAATLYLDDFFGGPQVSPIAPAMGDWSTNYSFTPSAGFGTTTGAQYLTRRVGDSLEYKITFSSGTVAASTASLAMPSGLIINSAKLPSPSGLSAELGIGTWGDPSPNGLFVAGIGFATFFDGSDTSNIYIGYQSTSSTMFAKVNGNGLFGSNAPITIWGSIPIAGWSSNSVASSDTDTRVCAATYYLSANSTPSSNQINFDSMLVDTHAAVTTGSGAWKFTAPVSGIYSIDFSTAPSAGSSNTILFKNGSNYFNFGQPDSASPPISASIEIPLNSGDFIDVRSSNGTTTYKGGAIGSGNAFTYISINRLSGPAVITATETVAANYFVSSNQSVSGGNIINFDTKTIDTHGAVSTGSNAWIFKVPVSGIYNVNVSTACTSGGGYNIFLNKNTVTFSIIAQSASTFCAGSSIIPANAGDLISIVSSSSQTYAGGAGSSNSTSISIYRI